jgi:hypothetical protein
MVRGTRVRTFAGTALLALALAGCKGRNDVTDIKTLLDDPSRFDHQVVRVAGDVTKSIGVLGYGGYQVNDGTGTITVVTRENGAPRTGAKVGVEGEFRSAFTLGTESVAVIMEQQRYTP